MVIVLCIHGVYHPELRGDQGGILHSCIVRQDAVGKPAEEQNLNRSAGVELRKVEDRKKE